MLMQGDLIVVEFGPVCIVSHACSMRREAQMLHDTQIVAPNTEITTCSDWKGSYDWMPLTGALKFLAFENPAACYTRTPKRVHDKPASR